MLADTLSSSSVVRAENDTVLAIPIRSRPAASWTYAVRGSVQASTPTPAAQHTNPATSSTGWPNRRASGR